MSTFEYHWVHAAAYRCFRILEGILLGDVGTIVKIELGIVHLDGTNWHAGNP